MKNINLIEIYKKALDKVMTEMSLTDEEKEYMTKQVNELAANIIPNPIRKHIRELINITSEDNVHFKFEFKVPTDVFTAMIGAISTMLSPLQEDKETDRMYKFLNDIFTLSNLMSKNNKTEEVEPSADKQENDKNE